MEYGWIDGCVCTFGGSELCSLCFHHVVLWGECVGLNRVSEAGIVEGMRIRELSSSYKTKCCDVIQFDIALNYPHACLRNLSYRQDSRTPV